MTRITEILEEAKRIEDGAPRLIEKLEQLLKSSESNDFVRHELMLLLGAMYNTYLSEQEKTDMRERLHANLRRML